MILLVINMSKLIYIEKNSRAIKIHINNDKNIEIARGYLYLIKNDLHDQPYGLIEDIFVDKNYRNNGLGNKILLALIKEAKDNNCYKLLAQSRHANKTIHDWYGKLGFENYGLNFRLNLNKK